MKQTLVFPIKLDIFSNRYFVVRDGERSLGKLGAISAPETRLQWRRKPVEGLCFDASSPENRVSLSRTVTRTS